LLIHNNTTSVVQPSLLLSATPLYAGHQHGLK